MPEPSDLCTTRMLLAGSVRFELRFWIAGSFHIVTFPAYMSAATCPVRWRLLTIPGILNATVTAPMVPGIVSAFGAFAMSAAWSGASEAAKSTVLPSRAAMPPPLPID